MRISTIKQRAERSICSKMSRIEACQFKQSINLSSLSYRRKDSKTPERANPHQQRQTALCCVAPNTTKQSRQTPAERGEGDAVPSELLNRSAPHLLRKELLAMACAQRQAACLVSFCRGGNQPAQPALSSAADMCCKAISSSRRRRSSPSPSADGAFSC